MNAKNKAIEKIHMDLISHLETLSQKENGWRRELNRISWNGGPVKYDIRDWAPDLQRFSRGVTLTDEQMNDLCRSLCYWEEHGKTLERRIVEGVKDTLEDSGITIDFYGHVGSLGYVGQGWRKELNICSWNREPPRYDLRDWSPDHQHMSRGIQFTEEEARTICTAYFEFEQMRLMLELFPDEWD